MGKILLPILIVLLISGCITRPSPSPEWFIKKESLEEKYPNHWIGFGQSSFPPESAPEAYMEDAYITALTLLAGQIDLEIHAMFNRFNHPPSVRPPSNIEKIMRSRADALTPLTPLIIDQALPNSFLIKEEIKNGVVYSAVAINKCDLKQELFEFNKDTHPELYKGIEEILDFLTFLCK